MINSHNIHIKTALLLLKWAFESHKNSRYCKVELTQKPKALHFLSFRADTWPNCWKNIFDLNLVKIFLFFFRARTMSSRTRFRAESCSRAHCEPFKEQIIDAKINKLFSTI